MKIGFIGLGKLGAPIAQNLVEKGHKILVYNRTVSKCAPLKEMGATVAESIARLGASSEIVFSIVSDDAALKSICEGDGGLLAHMPAGAVHVSMSTILPATAGELGKRHREKGQVYISAPVFGRPQAARARKLNYVISGDPGKKEIIKPFLSDSGAAGIWDFGEEPIAANVVKLCGNFMIGACNEAMGESIELARRSGVDAARMWQMFGQTLFNAPIFHTYSPILLEEKFDNAAFSVRLGHKDMRLVNEQAKSAHVPMPLAALLLDHMQALINDGQDQLDWSAVSRGALITS